MKKEKKWLSGLTLLLTVVILLSATGILGATYWIAKKHKKDLPQDFFQLASVGYPPTFYVYDFGDRQSREGAPHEIDAGMYGQRETAFVSYGSLPSHVINAFVAIEDKHFWEHKGVDWKRTIKAGANYILEFAPTFGASTITQQLIKNVTGKDEITPERKLDEIFWALRLEQIWDKTQIMETYLNIIHFSDSCNGIYEASRHYYSTTPDRLTVSQAAAIAAITNNPSYYNPIRHPDNNLMRRNLILGEMYNQGYITNNQYRDALAEPLGLSVTHIAHEEDNSWYVDMVIEDVIGDLMSTFGITRAAASRYFFNGGLRIYTAMDECIQEKVTDYYENAIHVPVDETGKRAESALIVLDSHTGDILGVAGGVGKKTGNRVQNHATQILRPPGSCIKPLTVYAPAIEQGIIQWNSIYEDAPVDTDSGWPKNADRIYRGPVDIPFSVAHSTNTVAVRVLEDLGLVNSFRFAKEKFGLTSLVSHADANDCDRAALALGQLNYGTDLRRLTSAYTAFADGGVYHKGRSYYRVTDADGRVLLSTDEGGSVILSQETAALMTKLMQGVIREGTSSQITLDEFVECAGKTGTSGKDHDRWFVGYTPDIVCGVWCGYDYPKPLKGKNICNRIWNDVMWSILPGYAQGKTFSVPASLVEISYCNTCGGLPVAGCGGEGRDHVRQGWFVRGTEPTCFCTCDSCLEEDRENPPDA